MLVAGSHWATFWQRCTGGFRLDASTEFCSCRQAVPALRAEWAVAAENLPHCMVTADNLTGPSSPDSSSGEWLEKGLKSVKVYFFPAEGC